jgi:glycosyltransferase involved in cell wall biosynthesis
MPEISVVIPAFNHAQYVGEAVESVLGQSLEDLELIVIDDGSTDGTTDVLARYRDPRMRVVRQANQGAHAAINTGLEMASAPYLTILNSDDAYHPQRLEKTVAVLASQTQVGLVGTYIEIVDSQGKSIGVKHGYRDAPPWPLENPERSFRAGDDLRAALLTENYWSTTSNFVFRCDLYRQAGPFRPLRYVHDWDFALRAALLAPQILLPEPLVRYRLHPTNTIHENQAAMIYEICWILAVHLPRHLADPALMPQLPEAERTELLMNSIYVFGMERVLSLMLLEDLQGNLERALQRLQPDDPVRAGYLAYIEGRLAQGSETIPGNPPQNELGGILSKIRRLVQPGP